MVHTRNCVQTDVTVLFNGVGNGADSADKHHIHLSQGFYCHMTERSKQSKHLVCNEDNDVYNGTVNGEDDSEGNGNDDGVDDGADSAERHL
eukprot:7706529-Ditylum_brightwellii.AAC.1